MIDYIRKAIITILAAGGTVLLNAQVRFSNFELAAQAGIFVYQGDLTPARLGSYKTIKPGINLYIGKIISPVLSMRTNLSLGFLKGDDSKYAVPAYRQQRNLNFNSPVLEISELMVADVLGNNRNRPSSGLSPYFFGGVGASFLKIRRDRSRFNAEYFGTEPGTLEGLAADERQALPKLIPVVPVGLGLRYPIGQRISITAETSYRFTFTDYLDGFSKVANPSRKDSYQSYTVGLIYQVARKSSLKCPVL